ncbi:MAG: HAD family hydrolase [Bacteroidales bacterium]|nr:HAD family hydrolase [Bacteroidales bacterium]
MGKYKHIIFDIDGTLVDTYQTGLGSLQVTIKEFLNLDVTLKSLEKYFGIPSFQAAGMIYPQDPQHFLDVWEEHYGAMRHYSHFFEGAVELLEKLKADGKKLGIVTSRALYELQHDPIMAPVMHLFDVVITSADSDKHKPNPDPTFAYLAKAGVSAEECLYVGDTQFDSECARGAGVDFALVAWNGTDVADGVPAKYRVSNADEIYALC